MAVPEQTPYIEHTGNGATTSFSLGFQCESKDHLIVLVDEIEPPIATWSLTGGNVVFTTAPASGSKITLQRNTPFSRTTDYQSYNNSFRPPAVNKDFDWIWLKLQELGVADWILGNRIDALKNYVDDRDDELRAYLMEEIRKQGVALDQLDEYYNYLMQRLAQIAVDKGWDASFVVDGDKNQHQINEEQNERKSVKLWAASLVDALSKYNSVDFDEDENIDAPVALMSGQNITSNGHELNQSTPATIGIETAYGAENVIVSGVKLKQDKSAPISGGTSNNHAMFKGRGGRFNAIYRSMLDGQYGISFGYGSIGPADRATVGNLAAFCMGIDIQGMFIENLGAKYTRIVGNILDSLSKGVFHGIRLSGYDKVGNPSESTHAPCWGVVGSGNVIRKITNGISAQNSSKFANLSALHFNKVQRCYHSTVGTNVNNHASLHRFDFTANEVEETIIYNHFTNHTKFGFAADCSSLTGRAIEEVSGLTIPGFNHYEGILKDCALTGAQFRYSHNLYNLQIDGSSATGAVVSGQYGGGTIIANNCTTGVAVFGSFNNLQIVATNSPTNSISVGGEGNNIQIVTDGNVAITGNNNIITGRIGGTLSGTGTGNKLIGEVVGAVSLSDATNDLKQLKGFSGVEQQSITTDATGTATIALSNRNSSALVRHCSVEILNNTSDLRAVIKSISGANVAIKLLSKTGADITAETTVTAMVSWSN